MDLVHQINTNKNRHCWQLKGASNPKTALAYTDRRRLNIISVIIPPTLKPTDLFTWDNCCEEVIIAFLNKIKLEFANAKTICVVLDNAMYQRACSVQDEAWLLGIQLIFLPPYRLSLNLIERLLKFFKKNIIKNKYYESYKIFEQVVNDFFKNYDLYKQELRTLLKFKFGIIKVN